jgi:hypothetical protein
MCGNVIYELSYMKSKKKERKKERKKRKKFFGGKIWFPRNLLHGKKA